MPQSFCAFYSLFVANSYSLCKSKAVAASAGVATGDGLSASTIIDDELARDYISKYERGVLEPPLHLLLAYARSDGISTDVLIDDEMDLPEKPKRTRR